LITLYSTVTIFLSGFLLFLVEPLIAKKIMPWFGGSAAVWAVCLVFFQTALLLGYVYSRVLTTRFRPQIQALIHIALILISLWLLPLGPSKEWRPGPLQDPSWFILEMLTSTLGLLFVLLSSTGPLVQHWLARVGHETPYRLFALSNFASLAALLSYPFLIEPSFDTRLQSVGWSGGYAAFVLLSGLCAGSVARTAAVSGDHPMQAAKVMGISATCRWFGLAACGSMLLLSITNHISENVAAVPFLWILPLTTYLVTFVLAFSGKPFYSRRLATRFLALALGLVAYAIYNIRSIESIIVSLAVFLFALFIGCLFCHGELYSSRPSAGNLTTFYLLIALGGAAGAIFVGIAAPRLFTGVYELPLTLCLTAALAILCTWPDGDWIVRIFWIAITCCMLVVFGAYRNAFARDAIYINRSFYGPLRVLQSPHAGPEQARRLYHGTIEHGAQFLLPPRRFQPTTYYGVNSGIGMVLGNRVTQDLHGTGGRQVGVIGLGVGTLAAYGKTGDTYRFYEINHQVVDVAESLFTYLRETKAHVQIVSGDARLSLDRDRSTRFDVLAVDAFSGDAIPVHLLTREALALYLYHLRSPDGVLAFHVSNRYLDLAPVVRQLADEAGYLAILVRNDKNDEELISSADWVLVTRSNKYADNPEIKAHEIAIPARTGKRAWTDAYNNLFDVLKMPRFGTAQ
jgi:hypothetical protein